MIEGIKEIEILDLSKHELEEIFNIIDDIKREEENEHIY